LNDPSERGREVTFYIESIDEALLRAAASSNKANQHGPQKSLRAFRFRLFATFDLKERNNMMARKVWVYDPHSGGVNIPDRVKPRIRQRILNHANKHYSGKFNRIDVRFRGKFCYIDAYIEPFVPADNYDPDLYGNP
jgi:hypothetical protein